MKTETDTFRFEVITDILIKYNVLFL